MTRRTKLPTALAAVAVLPLLAAAPAGAAEDGKRPAPEPVVAAYFANWNVYDRGYEVADIPADNLNTILYAFGKPVVDATTGEVTCGTTDPWADYQRTPARDVDPATDVPGLAGNFEQLVELKAQQEAKGKKLDVLISVGGWSLSEGFSQAAATEEAREAFVASCIDTFIRGNLPPDPATGDGVGVAAGVFDGIDIDWEYPAQAGLGNTHTPQDRRNATLLFHEFDRQLRAVEKQTGEDYLLTAATPAGVESSKTSYELKKIGRLLDLVFVMTYDFHGAWDPTTNFNAPLMHDRDDPTGVPTWDTVGAIEHYLRRGVPADKLVLGVPFYGKQYANVPAENGGLHQPFDTEGLSGDVLSVEGSTTPTYHEIVDVAGIVEPSTGPRDRPEGRQGWERHWNADARVPFLYNPTTGRWISYDDPRSVARKAAYADYRGLRGVFAWEISQDSEDHALSKQLARLLPQPGR